MDEDSILDKKFEKQISRVIYHASATVVLVILCIFALCYKELKSF